MSGYVRIHRSLLGHHAFRNNAEAMAFACLVMRAQWKPGKVRYKERIISLKRGQVAISIRDFASDMDRDKAWVERLFKRLKSEAMVETVTEAGVTVLTLCNYDEYQADQDTKRDTDETGARQGQDTEQGREEGEGKNTPPSPRKRGSSAQMTSLPADWSAPLIASLSEKAKACAEQWTRGSYEAVAEQFVCYWRRTGKKSRDWRLTWCGWILREHAKVMRDQKFGNAAPDSNSATPLSRDQQLATLERSIELNTRMGKTVEAAEARKKLEALSGGNAAVAAKVQSITSGMFKAA